MSDIASMVAELAITQAEIEATAKPLYAKANELKFALAAALREQYPEEWGRWERGVAKFLADGIEISLKRVYDTDKLLAEFGEEMPDVVTTETQVVTKANGRKLARLWKDAAYARRLEHTLVQQKPELKVAR
jgi:hypothetical protein